MMRRGPARRGRIGHPGKIPLMCLARLALRLAILLPLTALLALSLAPSSALAKGGKPVKARPPAWTGDAGRPLLEVFDPIPMKAYGHVPANLPEGQKTALIVVLHGHGGTATGMLGYGAGIGDARNECWLAVEGPGTEANGGHSWDSTAVPGILACVDAALAKFPVDAKRVVLMGFSAGGTMSLLTYAARPTGFAGVYTVSSPQTPTAQQKGARVVVSLGTKDANYGGFGPSVQASEKTVVGRIVAMEGLEHNDLPDAEYTNDHIAWILESKAQSEVLRLPAKPEEEVGCPPETPAAKGKGGKYRHVLVFQAGGRGAPANALARAPAKAAAQAVEAEAKKQAAAGGDFGDLVADKSQDPLSKDTRGVITGRVLSRYGGPLVAAMGKLKGGDVSGPVESDAGWHVLSRDPAR